MDYLVGDIPRFAFGFANPNHAAVEYDGRGQLLAVKDADGNDIECYAYDKAGNMTKKTILVQGGFGEGQGQT